MKSRYSKMNIIRLWSLLLVLSVVSSTSGHAQRAVSELRMDAINVRSNTSSTQTRLDLFAKVPYNLITFINTAEGFKASYEISADIFKLDSRNRRQSLVLTRIWESSVVVNSFNATRAPQSFDHTTHSLELLPGRYLIEFQVSDKNASKEFVYALPVQVRDLQGPVALSDLILLDDFDKKTNTIFPRVSTDISTDTFGFEVFYEIYSDRARTVNVVQEMTYLGKHRSDLERTGRVLLGLEENRNESQQPVLTKTELLTLKPGRHQKIEHIPANEMEVGDYLVQIRLEDPSGQVLATSDRVYTSSWTGLADHLTNLDDAINQLQYIAKSKELQEIKAAASYNDRMERFNAFWKKRDPTPSTDRNESMEEYYYRIAYANREYGNQVEGWKTDRGQVIVSFGQPDDIVRHPYDFNSEPYEVWYYFRIGRKFIFVDKTGFGDFQLLRPIWDDRNRIR